MGMVYPKPRPKCVGPHSNILQPRPEAEADAVTGCSVRPENIDAAKYGPHRSEVRKPGNRYWWFTRPEGAALFRKEFKSRLVKS